MSSIQANGVIHIQMTNGIDRVCTTDQVLKCPGHQAVKYNYQLQVKQWQEKQQPTTSTTTSPSPSSLPHLAAITQEVSRQEHPSSEDEECRDRKRCKLSPGGVVTSPLSPHCIDVPNVEVIASSLALPWNRVRRGEGGMEGYRGEDDLLIVVGDRDGGESEVDDGEWSDGDDLDSVDEDGGLLSGVSDGEDEFSVLSSPR